MKALAVIGGVLAAAMAVVVISVGAFALDWFTTPVRGKLDARHQIYSGSSIIQAYDHFFNLCAAVQTDEARLDAQFDQLQATTDPDDKSRILTNIAGISSDRADAINTYNADAEKDYTIGQFRSAKLPFQIADNPYTKKGAHTTCAL